MKHTARTPVGVEITDVDLAEHDDALAEEVARLLAEHGVAVFPGQQLDDAGFTAFLERFGDLVFTTGETPLPDHPDLNIISNVGRTTPPRSSFHTDSSYLSTPPSYTALRAVTIPEQGGETLFTNQYAAFESLPDALRARLQDRTVTHVVTGLELTEDDETMAEHPLCWEHPISGRTALYLSTPQRCVAVSGMTTEDAESTIAYLYEHSTAEANTMRHAWSPGDVVMWDNRCVLHKADHSDVVGDRVMHRGMVAAPTP